ncbi:MAG TPA: glutathione S-transferase N-terminal domain-containing protein [Polyangiaceae bacterium]|mgnify:CR=1 FL=1|nr:glutathione S-transferase N-terminal domain-containing protein [Polyangiaceae bacterium]HMR76021.1 glutathione S-transferase N-terminal domain-containing protein [Polyangiaceae bacterium]
MNNIQSTAASVLRLGRGWFVLSEAKQPAEPLELYDHEACPFCRKVRDVLSELDLEYIEHTCPKGDRTKRPWVRSKGREQFPFLVDPNTGKELFESEDIITYLFDTYGGGRSLPARLVSPLNTLSAAAASLVRPRGSRVRPGCEERKQPDFMPTLWNFEASPYCRKVRETLCELNLDYHVKNVARRGIRRPELVALGGKMMVPYFVDPNTDTAMYESDDIVAYLNRTYG